MKNLFIFTFFALFLDQISKFFVQKNNVDFEIIPNFFSFELHYNRGIALSLPLYGSLQILLILLVLLFGGYYGIKHLDLKKTMNQFILGGIFGGALGNLIDRFWHGAVIDFISVWSFPVFNLADTFIFCSVCFLLFSEFKNKKES